MQPVNRTPDEKVKDISEKTVREALETSKSFKYSDDIVEFIEIDICK